MKKPSVEKPAGDVAKALQPAGAQLTQFERAELVRSSDAMMAYVRARIGASRKRHWADDSRGE